MKVLGPGQLPQLLHPRDSSAYYIAASMGSTVELAATEDWLKDLFIILLNPGVIVHPQVIERFPALLTF